MKFAIGLFWALAMIGLGLAQLAVGFMGIEHELGVGWAFGAMVLALLFRFMLPITIGTFFGATNVLGWHWASALLFTAPGILLMVPGVVASVLSVFRKA